MDLVQSDFACIAQLATHCDTQKLCVAVEEAKIFDMEPTLCDLMLDVEANWDNTAEPWNTLINGGDYLGCNGKTKRHLGLKRVFVYYTYARYSVLNSFNDTPNGSVTKTNNFSIPKPLKEIESFSDKYRSMAYRTWKGVEAYLCVNKDLFDNFNSYDCKKCGCNGTCNSDKIKGYGFKGSNVSKYGM